VKEEGGEKMPFIGSPSNFKDLNKIGHTLNGIYLVTETNRINIKR